MMKELIDLSDICISPHREPYESFLQFDRLREGKRFDKDVGLYGIVSAIFPIEHTATESVSSQLWVYPVRRGKKKAFTEKEVGDAVFAHFKGDSDLYAFENVKIPDSDDILVSPGSPISSDAVEKIAEHNKAALKNDKLRPLKKIRILNPENTKEQDIIGSLIADGSFEPKQLKRRRYVKIELKGYGLDLPFAKKALKSREDYLKELDSAGWACRRTGSTLRMVVKLALKVQERTDLLYDGKTHYVGEKSPRRSATLGYFPVFTERDTFIINGLERVPVCQLLSRAGLHISLEGKDDPTEDSCLSALIRPQHGPFLEMTLKPDDNGGSGWSVDVLIGKQPCDFISFLKDMGCFDVVRGIVEKASGIWPEESDMAESLSPYWASRVFTQLFQGKAGYDLGVAGRRSLNERLSSIFEKLAIYPPSDGTRHLTPEDIGSVLIYLEQAAREDRPPTDDPLDLGTKRVWLISDHIKDQIELLLPELKNQILFFLKNSRDVSKVPLNFSAKTSQVLEPLFHGELSQVNDDANPFGEISLRRKVTLLGLRGIRNTHGCMERRGVHASHYGRVCLTETPESENIGFNIHLALAARVEDGGIKTPYATMDDKSETCWLSWEDESRHVILPREYAGYSEKADRALARRGGGQIEEVDPLTASLVDKYRAQFLGIGANLIPFVQHNDNNRVMMGAKNMKQAVPLLYPETPLIKTGREDLVARLSGRALYARSPGVVKSVTEAEITVETGGQEIETYWVRPIRPTFSNTITMHRPLVKKGDRVEEGQVMADGACIRNGQLALGINLLVAYMPYYGLNFEDGIVISDRLVREDVLTSLHLRSFPFKVYGDERMSSDEKTMDMLPFSLDKGILCREGQEVRKGDRLFGKYRKEGKKVKPEWFRSPVNGTIIEISKEPIKQDTLSPTQVRYRMACQILEERKVSVGDKLMGRHGNKGVIARIILAEEMPHLEDGTPVDIILNPHGVISRMNLGQILETHLGWIVKHGGKKFKKYSTVAPFERVDENDLKRAFKDLEDTGVDEYGKTGLIDGRSGQRIENPVVVGYQYFMKLNHLVEDKINVRETSGYTLLTKQPPKGRRWTGGQRVGEMEVWALEAHLARHLLQEFMTVKSDAVGLRKRDLTQEYFDQDSPLDKLVPFQETLRVTAMLLRGLCLDMTFHDAKGRTLPLDSRDLTGLETIHIRLADPDTIKKWAQNREVTSPERPSVKRGKIKWVKQGLIDPAIFKDLRSDMAYIELVEPVIHPLFLRDFKLEILGLARRKKKPGHLENLLKNNSVPDLLAAVDFRAAVTYGPEGENEKVCYRHGFVSVPLWHAAKSCACGKLRENDGETAKCPKCDKPVRKRNVFTEFRAGAPLVQDLLRDDLKAPLKNALLSRIPVLPTDFRPLWTTHGEIHVKSELNDFYRQILEANRNLKNALRSRQPFPGRALFYLRARLQQAVNRLMVGDSETARENQKSLGDRIKGKEGILRIYHLGKRVDVSARSVIVPHPELEPDQAGIPLEMAIDLTRSKLLGVLSDKCSGRSRKAKMGEARKIIENVQEPIYHEMVKDILFDSDEGLLKKTMLILNRAPSLHKYNLLSFRPVCVNHKAIALHPLVCKFFNADFDGDQMGVFVPLSKEALAEAKNRLSPIKNLLSAANGRPMLHLAQDIVLGIYLLTSNEGGRKIFNGWFEEAGIIPVNSAVNEDKLVDLLHMYHLKIGNPQKTAALAQKIMGEGFREATLSGLTFSIFDVPYLDRAGREGLTAGLSEAEWKDTVSKNLARHCAITE